MVNAEKHKKIRRSLEAKLEKEVQDLELNLIEVLNSNPEEVIEELTVNNSEVRKFYNLMLSKEGAVLGSQQCNSILNYSFRTEFTLATIKLNYNVIKLDSDVIDNIKSLCYEALDVIQNIRELQNNNIDNYNNDGLSSIVASEVNNIVVNNVPIEYYSSKEFEDLIRLNFNYSIPNHDIK